MKKILLMLAAVFSLLTACKEHQPVTTEEIANDKIYLFTPIPARIAMML